MTRRRSTGPMSDKGSSSSRKSSQSAFMDVLDSRQTRIWSSQSRQIRSLAMTRVLPAGEWRTVRASMLLGVELSESISRNASSRCLHRGRPPETEHSRSARSHPWDRTSGSLSQRQIFEEPGCSETFRSAMQERKSALPAALGRMLPRLNRIGIAARENASSRSGCNRRGSRDRTAMWSNGIPEADNWMRGGRSLRIPTIRLKQRRSRLPAD